MAFVSDWLIDGDEFIVEQPVGHTAPTRSLARTETAVLENAACANCGNICLLIEDVFVRICALRPRLQAPFCSKRQLNSFTSGSEQNSHQRFSFLLLRSLRVETRAAEYRSSNAGNAKHERDWRSTAAPRGVQSHGKDRRGHEKTLKASGAANDRTRMKLLQRGEKLEEITDAANRLKLMSVQ